MKKGGYRVSKLIFHNEKCSGCGLCSLACSATKFEAYSNKGGFIHVYSKPEKLMYNMEACFLCKEHKCIDACPTGALIFDENKVKLIEEECIHCGLCVSSCPYNIAIFKDDKPWMCDLCNDDPKCVEACPWNAIELL